MGYSDLWYKVGRISFEEDVNVLFRTYDEDGYVPVSKRWLVWKINQPMKFVGELRGENRNAEIGLVINPDEIFERIKSGAYKTRFPCF